MKLLITILAITVGGFSLIAGEQKTEDYGYFDNKRTTPKEDGQTTAVKTQRSMVVSSDNQLSATNERSVIKSDNLKNIKTTTAETAIISDHSSFDTLLKKYVSKAGKVDYKGIKSEVAVLDKYLGYLSQNVPSDNKNEILAFWINAYNANTIKLIVDNYPIKSIMDLYGGKAFDQKWIKIGGETLSLNDIENNKIRAEFNESRIHFAVNCAAKSCPPILNSAWTGANLEANLQARAKSFVNNESYNNVSSKAVKISKIFEWYAKDFPSDIVSYLNQFSDTKIDPSANVSYIEYDWALNSK